MSRVSIISIILCCLLITINGCTSASAAESLPESDHPYSNNFEDTWPDISKPGATEIRLHFESLDLASYDKLILYDKYDNKLVTYDRGDSNKDFWTAWYTGDTLKVKLVTDNSDTDYGFKIDKVENRSDVCISGNSLAESYHPYSNNFEYKWPDITEPGVTEIRLHFENLDLASYDKLILYDKYDNGLVVYDFHDSNKDFWTAWYTGDTLKVKLVTDNSNTDYGFKIDKLEHRSDVCISGNSLAESYHPYANNFEYKWPDISKPGATEMRLHFENLDLDPYDKLVLYDEYDNGLVAYDCHDSNKDFWTAWYTGDTLKVKLVTDNSNTDYGFKIDRGEIRTDENVTTVFFESTEPVYPYTRGFGDGIEELYPAAPKEMPEFFQNASLYFDAFCKQIIEIGITLNILEAEDQSWLSKNIGWIFSGIGITLIGVVSKSIRNVLRNKKDEKSEND
ncbi:hypothetical protein MSMTP_1052 [Methanosarcina sp. MTP4]|uniref:hypothetical protein n=1 Tax=Methanosarcina sp. MTP4 TaxID=1434100 RepID=UPI0006161C6A|nr:hypothetical protein [Methanosarcina sp. MTP4]AKB24521.1 hypothetical protein MSMTP_1052 [Methanosarcina sp. MTP4]